MVRAVSGAVSSPKMSGGFAFALADLFVINRPYTLGPNLRVPIIPSPGLAAAAAGPIAAAPAADAMVPSSTDFDGLLHCLVL